MKSIFALFFFLSSFALASWIPNNNNTNAYNSFQNRRPSPNACVPDCISRDLTGVCISYTNDYCGMNVNCVPDCVSRDMNGSCMSYNVDFCGKNAECDANCVSRDVNGSCMSYGADACDVTPN